MKTARTEPLCLLALLGILGSTAAGGSTKPSESQRPRQHRIDVDINGDGRPEILVAREFVGWKAGDSFEVLSPASDGTLRSWGHLEFNPGMGFRVDSARKRLFVISPMAVSEFTLIVHELKPGLKVLSTRLLRQWGETEAAYEGEQEALKRYWARSKPIETYAESGDSAEPVWLGVTTRRPVAGLRRLDGKGWTEAPPWTPTLREHFLDRQRFPSNWSKDTIEADLLGDAAPEVLLSITPQSPGFEIYAREASGYNFLGRLPVRADEEFRIDLKARTILVDRHDAQVVYSITRQGAAEVRRVSRAERSFAEFQVENTLRAEFNADPNNPILEAPLASFSTDGMNLAWKRRNGSPARGVDLTLHVVNAGS
jgi:hypothetical protein